MLPNLLATRKGRLAAFFALYVTEGIPLGFAATAVATQLRHFGIGPAEIGAFVASFYLPWAFKWAFGPLVDVYRSQRWGHRRAWILGTQLMMAITLASLIFVPLPSHLGLFTIILLVHNTFAAMQDVAIDALAINTLAEDERGLASGLMFAGAAVGQGIGATGVLKLSTYTGFQPTFIFVALCILAVSAFVVLPMKEALVQAATEQAQGFRHALGEMRKFSVTAFKTFMSSRGAFLGFWFSILPAGAMSLSLALQSNLAVELGLSNSEIGNLSGWSQVVAAVCMVAGGWLSDKLGHRKTLFVYIVLMSLPPLYMAQVLLGQGYEMPLKPGTLPSNPVLVQGLWVATLTFNAAMGLMYGTRSAVMMGVTNPKVAGTQFTAYMSMANLAIAMAATWQGLAIEAFGYPTTLRIDAVAGVLCLLLLPFIKPPATPDAVGAPVRRARGLSAALALVTLAWIPFQLMPELGGGARAIAQTLFNFAFVAGAVVLGAALAMLPRCMLLRLAPWAAVALLLLALRKHIEGLAVWVGQAVLPALALMAGLCLLALARHAWTELEAAEA